MAARGCLGFLGRQDLARLYGELSVIDRRHGHHGSATKCRSGALSPSELAIYASQAARAVLCIAPPPTRRSFLARHCWHLPRASRRAYSNCERPPPPSTALDALAPLADCPGDMQRLAAARRVAGRGCVLAAAARAAAAAVSKPLASRRRPGLLPALPPPCVSSKSFPLLLKLTAPVRTLQCITPPWRCWAARAAGCG